MPAVKILGDGMGPRRKTARSEQLFSTHHERLSDSDFFDRSRSMCGIVDYVGQRDVQVTFDSVVLHPRRAELIRCGQKIRPDLSGRSLTSLAPSGFCLS